MLEHVGDPAGAGRVVARTDVEDQTRRYRRLLVPFDQEKLQSIVEREHRGLHAVLGIRPQPADRDQHSQGHGQQDS